MSRACYHKALVNGEIHETTMHYGLSATDILIISRVFKENLNQLSASSEHFLRCRLLTPSLKKNNSLKYFLC